MFTLTANLGQTSWATWTWPSYCTYPNTSLEWVYIVTTFHSVIFCWLFNTDKPSMFSFILSCYPLDKFQSSKIRWFKKTWYISNRPLGTYFGRAWFLDFLWLSPVWAQENNARIISSRNRFPKICQNVYSRGDLRYVWIIMVLSGIFGTNFGKGFLKGLKFEEFVYLGYVWKIWDVRPTI